METGQSTKAVGMPDAMAVRTVVAVVSSGAGQGARWEGEEGVIGTAADAALVLGDETVSRYHVRVNATAEGIRLSDLGSTNGTFLGNVRLAQALVPPGTRLRLGNTEVTLGMGLPSTVELHDQDRLGALRGQSQSMRRLMTQVRRVGQSNATVLIVGESGTGKELLARGMHEASPHADKPFVTVDCASITPTLIASELFGHERGAFTGAASLREGAFARANGGTLFFDEVGELPLELQSSLLGALERRRFCRVGGCKELAVDVRVVAATNRDLRRDVNAGLFRLDLYYRLAVVTLEVPPLRERPTDIPLLWEHFVAEESSAGGVTAPILAETLARLVKHSWPGNVRELRNYVIATLAMGEAPPLAAEMATAGVDSLKRALAPLLGLKYSEARSQLLSRFEQLYLESLLGRAGGNVAHAAREADMARSHLNDLLRRYNLR